MISIGDDDDGEYATRTARCAAQLSENVIESFFYSLSFVIAV